MSIAFQHMTLDEFLALPNDDPPWLELIDGVVVEKMSPREDHRILQQSLGARIDAYARPRALAIAIPSVRGVYGADALIPDLAIYRWARVLVDDVGEIAPMLHVVPDIAVEFLSPGQTPRQLAAKARRFLAAGVAVVLVIDRRTRSVRRITAASDVVLHAYDDLNLAPVVPGFQLTVHDLFTSLRVR